MSGWVKLYRSIKDWEWWDDDKTLKVWIYILTTANHESATWHGNEIKAGQMITSIYRIADECNLSVRSVRTALNHLISTGEVTCKPTHKYTLINVEKWANFQDSEPSTDTVIDTQTDKQATQYRHSTDTEPTTNKNNKNDKNDKNDKKIRNINSEADEVIDHLNMRTGSKYKHLDSTRKHIIARLNEGFTVQDCKDVIDKKCVEWMNTDQEKYIRPQTLFNSEKFQNYLNARVVQKGQNVF